jgi:hypothetical protein
MSTDQVEATRRKLDQMMNTANAAADRHARGSTATLEVTREFLRHTNDIVNAAIDKQTRR